MRTFFILLVVILLLTAARLCVFTVDHTEYVYLTQFGRHIGTYDGGNSSEAGLHFKLPWPVQSVQRLDRRLHYLDLPGADLPTRNRTGQTTGHMLTIDAYVCWRIADREAVDRFVRAVGTIEGAQAILDKDVNNELGAAIGQMEDVDLINTDAAKVRDQRENLPIRLLNTPSEVHAGLTLRERTLQQYGVEIVDIRLRRINYPAAVRPAIFDSIISERDREAARHQSEGERMASEIRSTTDLTVSKMRADADATSIEERGRGDAASDRILNEAAMLRPEFYTFLKELEDLQRLLSAGKTVLLLSTERFKALTAPLKHPGEGEDKIPSPSPDEKR